MNIEKTYISVEDERVVKRINYLNKTGAETTFLSFEPLIRTFILLEFKKY